jgi:hypothetical protein
MKSAAPPATDRVSVLEAQLSRNLVVVIFLAALGVVVQVAECYWFWGHGESDAACEVLKLCSSFFTLWLIYFLFRYYRRKFELMKATNALLPQDTLASSGLLLSAHSWSFVPEALACAVHAPPFLCFEVSMPYYDMHRGAPMSTVLNTDELTTVFMMAARSFLLIRGVAYLAGLSGARPRAYANLNQLNMTTWLSLRIAFHHAPARLLGAATTVLLTVLAFAMQTAERRVNHVRAQPPFLTPTSERTRRCANTVPPSPRL